MKLFKTSHGFIIAFGFDMMRRAPRPRFICWCDPGTLSWEPLVINQAGSMELGFWVNPEFVHECDDKIVAYQHGRCIELTYVGAPLVWSVRTTRSDQQDSLGEAA